MNLREMITEYQNEVANESLEPQRASEILIKMSALYGNILDETKKRQMVYNKVLLKLYDREMKANCAKVIAEASVEYEELLEAKNLKEVTTEITRALKYFLREKEKEFREMT